jgi:hypothetical protein
MPTKTRTADNDRRMEEIRRLVALQDTKFEEAKEKITAANQKMEGLDAKIDAVDAKMDALYDMFTAQEKIMAARETNVMEHIDAKVTKLVNAKIAKVIGSPNELIERQIAKTAATIFDSVQGQVAEQVESKVAVVHLEMTILAKRCLENVETCEARFNHMNTRIQAESNSMRTIETNMSDTIEAIVDSKFETCDDAFNHTFAVYKTKVDEHEEATIEIINKHKAATIESMNETVDVARQALYEERDDEERNAIVQAIVDSYYEDKRIEQEHRVRDAIVKFETKKCSYSLILEEMASKAHDTNNRVDQLRDIVYESEQKIAMQLIPQKIKEIEERMKNNSKFNINTRNNLNELEYKVDQSNDIVDGYEKMATTQFGNQLKHVLHKIKEIEISMQDDRQFNINTRNNLNELEHYTNEDYDRYYQGHNKERFSRKLPRMTPPTMNEDKLFGDIKTHLMMETPTHAGGVIDNDNDG